jgi:hypothetical protein
VVGDNPDGATAGNGSTFISNVVIFKNGHAKSTGMGC